MRESSRYSSISPHPNDHQIVHTSCRRDIRRSYYTEAIVTVSGLLQLVEQYFYNNSIIARYYIRYFPNSFSTTTRLCLPPASLLANKVLQKGANEVIYGKEIRQAQRRPQKRRRRRRRRSYRRRRLRNLISRQLISQLLIYSIEANQSF